MNHEVTILYKPEYLARPWGSVCTCGHIGAHGSEAEAEESKNIHLERVKHEQVEDQQMPKDSPQPI